MDKNTNIKDLETLLNESKVEEEIQAILEELEENDAPKAIEAGEPEEVAADVKEEDYIEDEQEGDDVEEVVVESDDLNEDLTVRYKDGEMTSDPKTGEYGLVKGSKVIPSNSTAGVRYKQQLEQKQAAKEKKQAEQEAQNEAEELGVNDAPEAIESGEPEEIVAKVAEEDYTEDEQKGDDVEEVVTEGFMSSEKIKLEAKLAKAKTPEEKAKLKAEFEEKMTKNYGKITSPNEEPVQEAEELGTNDAPEAIEAGEPEEIEGEAREEDYLEDEQEGDDVEEVVVEDALNKNPETDEAKEDGFKDGEVENDEIVGDNNMDIDVKINESFDSLFGILNEDDPNNGTNSQTQPTQQGQTKSQQPTQQGQTKSQQPTQQGQTKSQQPTQQGQTKSQQDDEDEVNYKNTLKLRDKRNSKILKAVGNAVLTGALATAAGGALVNSAKAGKHIKKEIDALKGAQELTDAKVDVHKEELGKISDTKSDAYTSTENKIKEETEKSHDLQNQIDIAKRRRGNAVKAGLAGTIGAAAGAGAAGYHTYKNKKDSKDLMKKITKNEEQLGLNSSVETIIPVHYTSLEEAFELGYKYFEDEEAKNTLIEQVALSIAADNSDRIFTEMVNSTVIANRLRKALLEKYEEIAETRVNSILEELEANEAPEAIEAGEPEEIQADAVEADYLEDEQEGDDVEEVVVESEELGTNEAPEAIEAGNPDEIEATIAEEDYLPEEIKATDMTDSLVTVSYEDYFGEEEDADDVKEVIVEEYNYFDIVTALEESGYEASDENVQYVLNNLDECEEILTESSRGKGKKDAKISIKLAELKDKLAKSTSEAEQLKLQEKIAKLEEMLIKMREKVENKGAESKYGESYLRAKSKVLAKYQDKANKINDRRTAKQEKVDAKATAKQAKKDAKAAAEKEKVNAAKAMFDAGDTKVANAYALANESVELSIEDFDLEDITESLNEAEYETSLENIELVLENFDELGYVLTESSRGKGKKDAHIELKLAELKDKLAKSTSEAEQLKLQEKIAKLEEILTKMRTKVENKGADSRYGKSYLKARDKVLAKYQDKANKINDRRTAKQEKVDAKATAKQEKVDAKATAKDAKVNAVKAMFDAGDTKVANAYALANESVDVDDYLPSEEKSDDVEEILIEDYTREEILEALEESGYETSNDNLNLVLEDFNSYEDIISEGARRNGKKAAKIRRKIVLANRADYVDDKELAKYSANNKDEYIEKLRKEEEELFDKRLKYNDKQAKRFLKGYNKLVSKYNLKDKVDLLSKKARYLEVEDQNKDDNYRELNMDEYNKLNYKNSEDTRQKSLSAARNKHQSLINDQTQNNNKK